MRVRINRSIFGIFAWSLMAIIIPLTASAQTINIEPNLASGPRLIAVQTDVVSQINADGSGVRIGTIRGAFSGTITHNLQFLAVPPPDFKSDDLVLLCDTDGDQILFRALMAGRFMTFLTGPTPDPAGNNNRKNLNAFGGPYTGTYEVLAATGKFTGLVGRKFPVKGIGMTPYKVQTIGAGYCEIYDDKLP